MLNDKDGKERLEGIARAQTLPGDRRLLAFPRWARNEPEVLACKLINERLDKGKTLDAVLSKPGQYGYLLEVKEGGDGNHRDTAEIHQGIFLGIPHNFVWVEC